MQHATFHEGEQAVQRRVGAAVHERLAEIGPQVIRGFMPDQHRDFFAQLPFVVVGSVDAGGQPWASVLTGPPGFMNSPDPQQLQIGGLPSAHDPLSSNLHDGAAVGLLGIEPHTRRRNRMNGVVQDLGQTGFAVHVSQSFGNCPKYIQARRPEFVEQGGGGPQVHEAAGLDDAARRMIAAADTFFIATAHAEQGADVSHRGGKPGFVRVDDDGTLTAPDFLGNFFFNTLGNIALEPRAGLLFIDFENGDLLYLAVQASIIWGGPEVDEFKGAQRLLRFKVTAMRRVTGGLPLRWGVALPSPQLQSTGSWVN